MLALEPAPARRRTIESWGVETRWADEAGARATLVAEWFPGRGADVVIECSRRPGSAAEAIRITRRGGLAVLTGITALPESVDTLDLVLGEKRVVGSAAHMWDDDLAVAVELIAEGRVEVSELVTHTVALAEVHRAFELLADPTAGVVKLLVGVGVDTRADEFTAR